MQNDDKIKELTEALNRERQARLEAESDLEAAERARYEFISLVTHELRVPMTSIRGYTDLLVKGLMGPVNEAQTNFLNVIRSNVERMSRMVAHLSDINKIEQQRLNLNIAATPLKSVLDEVIEANSEMLTQKQQTLTQQLPETLPNLAADASRLNQILDALLNNAIKYTPENGHIKIMAEPLPEQAVLHIAVQDDGIGILENEQHRIFEKFFRASDEETRATPGNGLALYVAKLLVELHHGQIAFESQRGQGTTFHLHIPLAPVTV